MSSKTIVRREECNVKLIDALVKNKWRWTWMEEEHTDGVVFGVYMRKITKPGYALCLWCDAPVNYGGKGLSSIKQHASTDVHQANRKTRETNYLVNSPNHSRPPNNNQYLLVNR